MPSIYTVIRNLYSVHAASSIEHLSVQGCGGGAACADCPIYLVVACGHDTDAFNNELGHGAG